MLEIKMDDKSLRILLKAAPKEVLAGTRATVKRAAQAGKTELGRQIRTVSYLKGRDVKGALLKPFYTSLPNGLEAEIRVSGNAIGLEHFKLRPKRVTARRGQRSVKWKSPGYQLGPGEPVRYLLREGEKSAAFLAVMANGNLLLMRRHGRYPRRTYGVTPQYFAAFDSVRRAIRQKLETVLPQRLHHEIRYRLGKMS